MAFLDAFFTRDGGEIFPVGCAAMSRSVSLAALAVAASLAACGDNVRPGIVVVVGADDLAAIQGLAALVPASAGLEVRMSENPAGERLVGPDLGIRVTRTLSCAECYRIVAVDGGWLVHAGDRLGAQYGVAHALENLGFRFRHPFDTYAPAVPAFDPDAAASLDVTHTPVTRVRGFQFHTLHPTEAYFALWEPGADHLAEAARIFSWVAANRGNFVQWVGLDDIMAPDLHAAWRDHTAALHALADVRGLRTGLNIQLYGQSNLQRAFDLSDDDTGTVPLADELAARLPLVTDGVAFDVYDLSFGEFFSADPAAFVADIDATAAAVRVHAPAAEMHGLVHVGGDQRVTYMGEDLIYYFLVKFADPRIVPDIHTVMFYDLYEDAGGAYHHDDFSEHRAYLLERIAAGEPNVYIPETAYWVAFDDSVPLYLPLYVRNRWLDLDRLRTDPAAGGNRLDGHVIFSTGWEWGYWLNDYAALRASYADAADWTDLVRDAFADDLAPAVDAVAALVETQRAALLDGRLVAYLAGRDAAMDLGESLDIVSQPDRPQFAELADAAVRDPFAADVLPRLDRLADDLAAHAAAVAALGLDGPWAAELVDGFAITAVRARFAATAFRVAVDHHAGDAAAASAGIATLRELLDTGAAIVASRHAALHDPSPARLVERNGNRTFYGYGYLHHADNLCFWRRELAQLERMTGASEEVEPNCLL
jgi:hypothetical protein